MSTITQIRDERVRSEDLVKSELILRNKTLEHRMRCDQTHKDTRVERDRGSHSIARRRFFRL